MKEYLLSTNNFGEPRIYSDNEARGLNILRLLLLIQGHNPLFPKMGCNLVQFRHITKEQLGDVRSLIEQQINTYLPECLMASVELEVTKNNYLNIIVMCKDAKYIFNTESMKYPMQLDEIY